MISWVLQCAPDLQSWSLNPDNGGIGFIWRARFALSDTISFDRYFSFWQDKEFNDLEE